MYKAAASCNDIAQAPVTNWAPQCVTLAGYCYAMRHGMKVQLVSTYHISHVNKGLTRCNSIHLFTATSLYMFRVSRTHHQEY